MLAAMSRAVPHLPSTFVALVLLAACSSSPTNDVADASPPIDAPIDALSPPDLPRTQTEAELAPRRGSCTFARGAWAAETIGKEYPLGADIPVKHVIVIMQENRSFDNYLARLVPQGYYEAGDFSPGGSGFEHHDQLDVPPAGWSNPDGAGGVVVPHPDDEHCFGVNHGWADMHEDWNHGANDGFVINNNPNGQRSFFYEDDTVIPFYYALADTFGVGDRYFASVMSPTWPNRYFLMAASSFGIGDNAFFAGNPATPPGGPPEPQIFTLLNESGHTWSDYTDSSHMVEFFADFGFRQETREHFKDVKCDLMNDIANDTLPDVAFVMGDEIHGFSDEGPSALPGIGGLMVEQIMRALFASPAWKDTVVFITYDENGGMADHVPPVPMCAPDGFAAHDMNGLPLEGDFETSGFRVPFTVVSPYAKAHFVSHQIYDHTSITRFIEAKFGLPALSARDANATPPFEMFDFENPPFLTPPEISAHTSVDPAVMAQCGQALAPMGCTP
jgi:phospholipase C